MALLLAFEGSWAQEVHWQLGGAAGEAWTSWTGLNVMVDDAAVPGSIQPLELKPDQNLVLQLRNWTRYREPIDIHYREGMPRVWRGIGDIARPGHVANEIEFIDGDLNTNYIGRLWEASGGKGGVWGEFYTLDLGGQMPVDRFVLVPPEGVDPFFQEPYRPNYAFKQYQVTASNNQSLVESQVETAGGVPGAECNCPDYYQALDIPLASEDQNFDPVIDVRFPLQYLRFLRMRVIPDAPRIFTRYAIAELEVFGRGFVPKATWESEVIDLGKVVNLGKVVLGISKWRREGEGLVSAPEADAAVEVKVKTGLDDTPISFNSYNDMAQAVEVSEAEYEGLKPRVWPWDPPAVGWRGPIADDRQNWSFWSAPLRSSGERPRAPRGRYIQLQVSMETRSLWEFARLDSIGVEAASLLAERVLGEVALASLLQPPQHLVQVQVGELAEFAYEIRADFSSTGQDGFDAIRLRIPAAQFQALAMGQPLVQVTPDSVVAEAQGLVVYLPQRVSQARDKRLRLHLKTAIYGASDELRAEVFRRAEAGLVQEVEAGDASPEVGTDRLVVVALGASLQGVLGKVEALPAAFTPQGDGVNDRVRIKYSLFRVLVAAEVKVEIYTLGGRRVRGWFAGTQGAGAHEVEWDGRDDQGERVAPGVYLARVQVETDGGTLARTLPVAVAY
ncbi:MAG: hypothetical protein FJY95_00835 [Candidatus Handelsmanbacteria bacterium]|nr:hypothetical protein [Candidatus Handelsmanbacteria bacterium]